MHELLLTMERRDLFSRPVLATRVRECQKFWYSTARVANRGAPGLRLDVEDDDEESIMKIRPLHDRIVVKRLESENRTKGGIIIPDTAKEKPIEGRVVAVGNGKLLKDGKLRPLDVAIGDVVLFGKYAGNEVKIDGETFVLLREDDLLAVTEAAQPAR
jgi:chaperonin GroES